MSITTERALRKAMRERSFERVYYFVGEDDFLKDAAVRELMAAVLEPAARDFNLETLRGTEAAADTLDTALATPPMFAERRLVVIREASALRKEPRAVLERYLRSPAADTVLLLVDPASEKPDKAIADAAFVVEFPGLSSDRVPAWIVHHATTALGVAVTEGAARVLQAFVGSETAALASELDKLSSYTGGGAIDEEAVRAVVGARPGETPTDLLDAVAVRDAARAVALVPVVLAQPKANAVTVIMSLATQMTAIAWGKAARDRGVPVAGVERGFYALLKEGKAFPGRPWKDAVACWQRGTQEWASSELDLALRDLLAADAAAKEARVSSEEQLLVSLVLALCGRRQRKAA